MTQSEIKEHALDFILAGRATFTIENTATGGRFTYQVQAPGMETEAGGRTLDYDAPVRFVKVLTGPENTSDYTFLGTVFTKDRAFRHSHKSRVSTDAPSVRAFDWLIRRLAAGAALGTVRVLHAGKCARCGRKLTVPESIETGFGPECSGRMVRS